MAQGGPVAPPAGLRAATSLLRYGSSQPAFCSSDTEAAALPWQPAPSSLALQRVRNKMKLHLKHL